MTNTESSKPTDKLSIYPKIQGVSLYWVRAAMLHAPNKATSSIFG